MKHNTGYINLYRCSCGKKWEQMFNTVCSDKCPDCGEEVKPFTSLDSQDQKELALRPQEIAKCFINYIDISKLLKKEGEFYIKITEDAFVLTFYDEEEERIKEWVSKYDTSPGLIEQTIRDICESLYVIVQDINNSRSPYRCQFGIGLGEDSKEIREVIEIIGEEAYNKLIDKGYDVIKGI
jgi:hypothetical protein